MDNQPKLDRNLNLVFDFGDGVYAYVQPVSLDMWDAYRINFGYVLEEIKVLQFAGTAVAADLFREACEKRGVSPDPFFAEIKRCTTIGYPDDKEGFATVPFGVALAQKKIDTEAEREIANFLCYWLAGFLKRSAIGLCLVALGTSPVVGTSSTFMEFLNSLRTLTTDDATGEKTTEA
ncbi:hypothetical protein [Burkholderia seminalis]|uniref:hypothetical protein n=1 Tax=Burkholderia seminalis TaxID=488731 RepID=UPI000A6A6A1A|nr:hypothetical protein [Burkholderia seminalis]